MDPGIRWNCPASCRVFLSNAVTVTHRTKSMKSHVRWWICLVIGALLSGCTGDQSLVPVRYLKDEAILSDSVPASVVPKLLRSPHSRYDLVRPDGTYVVSSPEGDVVFIKNYAVFVEHKSVGGWGAIEFRHVDGARQTVFDVPPGLMEQLYDQVGDDWTAATAVLVRSPTHEDGSGPRAEFHVPTQSIGANASRRSSFGIGRSATIVMSLDKTVEIAYVSSGELRRALLLLFDDQQANELARVLESKAQLWEVWH